MTPANPPARRRAWIRTWWRPVVALALTTGVYVMLPLTPVDLTSGRPVVRWTGVLVLVLALTWLIVHQIRRATATGRRLGDRVAMLVTLVQVVVVSFAAVYVRLGDQIRGLDTRLDGLYFSMTTLTTVGYGDIAATGQAARLVVLVQMFFDLVVVTSATSIVIGALRAGPPAERPAQHPAAGEGGEA